MDSSKDKIMDQPEFEIEGRIARVVDMIYNENGEQTEGDIKYYHGLVRYTYGWGISESELQVRPVSYRLYNSEAEAMRRFRRSSKVHNGNVLTALFPAKLGPDKKPAVCFERFNGFLQADDFKSLNDAMFKSLIPPGRVVPKRPNYPYLRHKWTTNPRPEIQKLIKCLIKAFRCVRSQGYSCGGLDKCTSFVWCGKDREVLKIMDIDTETNDPEVWDSHLKNLGTLIDQVILYCNWPAKTMFVRCFDSRRVKLGEHSDRFVLLLDHPILKKRSSQILRLLIDYYEAEQRADLINNTLEHDDRRSVKQVLTEETNKDIGLTPHSNNQINLDYVFANYIDAKEAKAMIAEYSSMEDFRMKSYVKSFAKKILSGGLIPQTGEQFDWSVQLIEDTALHGILAEKYAKHSTNVAMRSDYDKTQLLRLLRLLRHAISHFEEKCTSLDRLLSDILRTWPRLLYFLHEYKYGQLDYNLTDIRA